MKIIYIHLCLLNWLSQVESFNEYVPVLIWSSPHFHCGPTLALNKINSELFESFLKNKLSNKRPLVVLFLEQELNAEDFDWRDKQGANSFPFLSNINAGIQFFPSVQDPHRICTQLSYQGYACSHLHYNLKLDQNQSLLLLVEFRNIIGERPASLRNHDEVIANVSRRIEKMSDDWVCIYTARHRRKPMVVVKKLSAWHVDPEPPARSQNILCLYYDQHTGWGLLTKGPIKLYLPTKNSTTVKLLDKCFAMSATNLGGTFDIIMWFQNYTLTFNMSLLSTVWVIDIIHIQNAEGGLELLPKPSKVVTSDKCYPQLTEFESHGQSHVKIQLSKYMLIHISEDDKVCKSFYSVTFLSCVMSAIIFATGLAWNIYMPSNSNKENRAKTINFTFHDLCYKIKCNN